MLGISSVSSFSFRGSNYNKNQTSTGKNYALKSYKGQDSTVIVNPTLTPTDKPIIKYTTKNGENLMAREVRLENGYTCMAVSNEKNPKQAILMNKEEFQKFFLENAKQISTKTSFTGKSDKKASGTFANKSFEIECKEGFKGRSISGKVDDLDFNIKHNGKFFKADTMTGNIGDKELNLEVKEDFFSASTIKGTLGDDVIDLEVSGGLSGCRIKGEFKGKKIDIYLNSKIAGYSLESDNMSLEIKGKSLFGNDLKVNGTYNEDPDLIPILMDTVYSLNNEQLAMAMMICS